MADERRHDRRNARDNYATGGLGFWIRDSRQRFLPTEHGPVALPLETEATYEYQNDSSSKRPVSSVTLASRRPMVRFSPFAHSREDAASGCGEGGKSTIKKSGADTLMAYA